MQTPPVPRFPLVFIALITTTCLACALGSSMIEGKGEPSALAPSDGKPFPLELSSGRRLNIPSKSELPLTDYQALFLTEFLQPRLYQRLGWAVDVDVRDTGPFANQVYYGTHPAVRIYYSPEVTQWLNSGREGDLADGAVIVKEMLLPPAAIYLDIRDSDFFRARPQLFPELFNQLVSGWSVMVMDRGGDSKDGWWYSGMGARGSAELPDWLGANLDHSVPDAQHPYYSNFGLGTCVRCHASAEKENTFSSLENITGTPLQFRDDDSWRDKKYLNKTSASFPVYTLVENFLETNGAMPEQRSQLLDRLALSEQQRPWRLLEDETMKEYIAKALEENHELALDLVSHPLLRDELEQLAADLKTKSPKTAALILDGLEKSKFVDAHARPMLRSSDEDSTKTPAPKINSTFASAYNYQPVARNEVRHFPSQWTDDVYPGATETKGSTTSAHQYITSSNCMGCHGGLGGAPTSGSGYPVNMFVKTGPQYGDGYNISEYGEWRWSPMGLAGRDPIFHAQLESELILLIQNAGEYPGGEPDPKNPLVGSLEANKKALTNTCLSCHGAMGQRQLHIDAGQKRKLPNGQPIQRDFNPDYFYLHELTSEGTLSKLPKPFEDEPTATYSYPGESDFYNYYKYGELAREGISCAVCHHINAPGSTPDGADAMARFVVKAKGMPGWMPENHDTWDDSFIYFMAMNTTGQYERGPGDELNGPFEDSEITPVPMDQSLGITPKYNAFIRESEMCGTCHTINLPNIGLKHDENPVLTAIQNNPAFKNYNHSIEQATYLEWLNSSFGPGKYKATPEKSVNFKSCQDCHMPNRFATLDGEIEIESPLVSQIASIQDTSYPQAEHALPPKDMTVPLRSDYRRHEFVGLNAFLIEMGRQFPDVMGLELNGEIRDFETSATTGPQLAIDNMLLSAKENRVVEIAPIVPKIVGKHLVTEVKLTNRTGHRFPSGVSFRRAFIEFSVLDASGKVLWISGDTNAAGLITDGKDGDALKTELLNYRKPESRIADYQPHYQVIEGQHQVQIYEELIIDADDEFTTSFIHRVEHVKDNRMLPQGWIPSESFAMVEDGSARQGEVLLEFMRATDPEGASVTGKKKDPNGVAFPPDPNYVDTDIGSDSLIYKIPRRQLKGTPAEVRVRVISQALMPFWFHQRFELGKFAQTVGLKTPEIDRLYYVSSRLDLKGTPLEGWKLPLVEARARIEK
jgi:mono/diheme cytochrome c family protein